MALSRSSKVFLSVMIVFVVVVGGGLYWASWLLGGDPGAGETVEIEVASGATAATIGDLLAAEGVVRSSLAFRLKARSERLDAVLQAGLYELETGMSVDEAIERLLAGPRQAEALRFTVPEGLDVEQTIERLAAQTPFSAAEFRAVLDERTLALPEWVPPLDERGPEVREPYEGLLFPETYELADDATAQQILQRMVDQLDRVVTAIDPEQVAAAETAGYDRYEVLVLASLVERETRVADERPLVSAVIWNRLSTEGYRLQIDATVLYAIGEHKPTVTQDDLEVESPYNTYRVDGLPPTPISGAGSASVRAAFGPADVTHLYYVLNDCGGTHAFADTLDEHNVNVQAYRQLDCS